MIFAEPPMFKLANIFRKHGKIFNRNVLGFLKLIHQEESEIKTPNERSLSLIN